MASLVLAEEYEHFDEISGRMAMRPAPIKKHLLTAPACALVAGLAWLAFGHGCHPTRFSGGSGAGDTNGGSRSPNENDANRKKPGDKNPNEIDAGKIPGSTGGQPNRELIPGAPGSTLGGGSGQNQGSQTQAGTTTGGGNGTNTQTGTGSSTGSPVTGTGQGTYGGGSGQNTTSQTGGGNTTQQGGNSSPYPAPTQSGSTPVASSTANDGGTTPGTTPGTSPTTAPSSICANSDPRCQMNQKYPRSEPVPPSETSEPKPVPPPGKVVLELRVVQLNYESWWKNCLTVSIDGQSKQIGCNKDQSSLGRVVYFLANQAPACNSLKVLVDTYKLTDGGTECVRRKNLVPPQSCEGPYASYPTQSRTPTNVSDRDFFKTYDYATVANHDPLIRVNMDWSALQADMTDFRKGGVNRWLRIFFEDQPQTNLDYVRYNPSAWRERGIDYNDYIFDVAGENVKFHIEGSGTSCDAQ